MKYLPFEEARAFSRSLHFKSRRDWYDYCRSGKRNLNIPAGPRNFYKKEWKGWGDWLGTGTIAPVDRDFLPFEDARTFVHNLSLKNQQEWKKYLKDGQRPLNIPTSPSGTYRNDWKGLGDWLGTGNIANRKRQYQSFEEARKFVHNIGLKSFNEWQLFAKSESRPKDIPYHPERAYKSLWKGWGFWLGTNSIATQTKVFKPFEEAREFVHLLGLKNLAEWRAYCKSGRKPTDIPSLPHKTYRKQWTNLGDWLGTGFIHPGRREYRDFQHGRNFVHSLKLNSQLEWDEYCKSGMKPEDMPANVRLVYGEFWNGYGDWLETGNVASYA